MTEKERIEKFKSSQLVVNCQTEDEAKKLVEWCYENGIKWETSVVSNTNWYDETTCYRRFPNGSLSWSTMESYENCGFEIITCQDFFKEDEMTNLEYIIENFKESYNDEAICSLSHIFKTGYDCDDCVNDCKECEFNNAINVLKYLAEKHNDKIKVTQFEYDVLDSINKDNTIYNITTMLKFPIFIRMKEKGYFKNIDGNMYFAEVYKKLEVEK